MKYTTPLLEGKLIKRYKRFLADVLINGEEITVHTPNSGSMAGLLDDGNRVRISGPYGGTRKLKYTLEQIEVTRNDGETVWVGVNTMLPNKIVHEALLEKRLPGLEIYSQIKPEAKIADGSRIDFRLDHEALPTCWVEVKNVTLVQKDVYSKQSLNDGDIAAFPDAVTARGAKHLRELVNRAEQGDRTVMVYVIQRADGKCFSPAYAYDPTYCDTLKWAVENGVEVIPIQTEINRKGVTLTDRLAGPGMVLYPRV
ncbi:DNA/RNA nuclease SfsA [bacterium]|nr:DNA/RNA nuclease SfsA [bacterium]